MSALGRLGPGPLIGFALVGLFLVAAFVGPLVAPYPMNALDPHILASPSGAHLLGTDENGRDLLSEVLFGARLAASLSLAVVAVSLVIGLVFGTLAGYFGGTVDNVLMRVVDILLAFPGILLNIAIVSLVAHPGFIHLFFALTINGWVGYARVARGQVLELREREFVVAARALGASSLRVMLRHVIPNVLTPLTVQATAGFAGVILAEASLSFLGVGRLQPYSWGSLLDQGTTYLWRTQRLALVAGACIAAVVFGWNLLGDGLRDRLDPKQIKR